MSTGCLGLVALLTLPMTGCGTSSKEEGSLTGDDPRPPDPPTAESIEFVPPSPLSLAPSTVSTLTVKVTPLRLQNVTFELLSESSSFDGFIVQSEARARDDGTATVEIQAPSGPTIFRVRASLSEGFVAVRTVLVVSEGHGTIEVTPGYGGSRTIRQWTASAHVNQTCDGLNSFWEDGALVATGASKVTVTEVPLGVPIALTLRGGPLVAGCTTLSSIRADDVEDVTVNVTDRPVDVRDGRLGVKMGITSSTAGFSSHLEAAITLSATAFRGDFDSDASALVDLMAQNLTSSDRSSFLQSVETHSLLDSVRNLYGTTEPVSQSLRALLSNAGSQLSGDGIFQGELELSGDTSTLTLKEVAGVAPDEAGFSAVSNWIVGAEAPDTVVISGTLDYSPLKWLHALASDLAEAEPPSQILVNAARCDDVAVALFEGAQGAPFDQCDTLCLEALCSSALAQLWENLRSVEDNPASLQVGLSGNVRLYGAAKIESFEGSWVGRLGTEEETSVAGSASGQLVVED